MIKKTVTVKTCIKRYSIKNFEMEAKSLWYCFVMNLKTKVLNLVNAVNPWRPELFTEIAMYFAALNWYCFLIFH